MDPVNEQNYTPHLPSARRRGGVFLFTLYIFRGPAAWLVKKLHTHFHKRYKTYRHAKLLFGIDLALVGVVIILAITTGWIMYQRFEEARVLGITGRANPAAITSGATVAFTFSYENKSREPLQEVVLAFRLPPNFELLRSFPADFITKTSTLPIGMLAPGERGRAVLFGRLWGTVGTSAPVLVTAPFTREANNRRLIAFQKFEFPIQNSVLTTSLILPDRLIAGQAVPFKFSYKNNGTEPLLEVLVRPQIPSGATIHSDEKTLTEGAWHLGTMMPDESGVIRGEIALPASPSTDARIVVQSSIIRNNEELVQSEITVPALVSPTPLAVSATTTRAVARPGTEIPVTIRVENTGDATLHDVAVSLATTSPAIDVAALKPPINIGELLPAASKTITTSLPLRELVSTQNLKEGDTDHELSVIIRPEVTALLNDALPIPLFVYGEDIKLPLETPFALTAAAHYYTPEGDQIGRGPIPPTVGKTTKYWITWEFTPTTNELEGFVVRAKLPPNVEWINETNATVGRAPRYESESRTVRWTIDHLTPTLASGEALVARFEIALTPTEALRGSIPLLLEETSAQAFDEFTETQLFADAEHLTTALPDDEFIRARIRVR